MGATPEGKQELIAVVDGYRESEQSWYEMLFGIPRRLISREQMRVRLRVKISMLERV